jgi:hypothetical protein
VLWRDVKVWDQLTRMPIAVAPADASVQLGPEIAHAELSYLDDSQPRTAVSGNRFEVALLGDPVVVSLSI